MQSAHPFREEFCHLLVMNLRLGSQPVNMEFRSCPIVVFLPNVIPLGFCTFLLSVSVRDGSFDNSCNRRLLTVAAPHLPQVIWFVIRLVGCIFLFSTFYAISVFSWWHQSTTWLPFTCLLLVVFATCSSFSASLPFGSKSVSSVYIAIFTQIKPSVRFCLMLHHVVQTVLIIHFVYVPLDEMCHTLDKNLLPFIHLKWVSMGLSIQSHSSTLCPSKLSNRSGETPSGIASLDCLSIDIDAIA